VGGVLYLFHFSRDAKYCDQRVYLSVCLSTRVSQKPHVQISPNFLYKLPVAVARSSSDDNKMCYVLPVLWTTSRFDTMEQMGRNQSMLYVEFARWRHWGRSRSTPTASCCIYSKVTGHRKVKPNKRPTAQLPFAERHSHTEITCTSVTRLNVNRSRKTRRRRSSVDSSCPASFAVISISAGNKKRRLK